MKKIAYHTLGCKLNFAETSALMRKLHERGFENVKSGEEADICIINTCSVTDTADKKCRQAIHRFVSKHPSAFVIVTGCYAQLKPNEVSDIQGVDMVIGSNAKFEIADILQKIEEKSLFATSNINDKSVEVQNILNFTQNNGGLKKINVVKTSQIIDFQPVYSADDRTRHFLKVQDGCDYYCTYCTIPFARGRSRNSNIINTLQVVNDAIKNGAKEIVLTGINIGDFGKSTNETFFDLIKEIDKISAEVRYRISSIEPNLLTDEMIEFIANSQHFMPHFHIPLQSGSDAVLALMKRRYTTLLFLDKTLKIKSLMPDAFIGVDIMAGMRGETDEFFIEALEFLQKTPFSQLHVFTYSERTGTKALDIQPIIPQKERKRRSEILHQLSALRLSEFYASQKGKSAVVLWEGGKDKTLMHGFTENYVKVSAPYNKDLINTFQKIVI
ncbi:MAG: tRNA (N(6)-L-threonylcarbamoyladenosine(37)-C(2))-methylthiotransferase MtaB [Prevotellaceae bacterium]|jgi:threonylcarbamoyladenosine tRNA methylthiotransferase MtaB|nr:tRNA (N(6)-L-threonylcarbamoyladenosine(37)-C(2))-methylthiotransferase MtaB [Prevotellaceae bacterium]